MQVVLSMYHQCINFPHNDIEVYVPTNSSYSCNTLKQSTDMFVSHNRESTEIVGAKQKDREKSLELKDTRISE